MGVGAYWVGCGSSGMGWGGWRSGGSEWVAQLGGRRNASGRWWVTMSGSPSWGRRGELTGTS